MPARIAWLAIGLSLIAADAWADESVTPHLPSCFAPDEQLRRKVEFEIVVGKTTQAELVANIGPADHVDAFKWGGLRWMYYRYNITRARPKGSLDEVRYPITVWDCADKRGVPHPNAHIVHWELSIWFDRDLKVTKVEEYVDNMPVVEEPPVSR